MKLKTRILFSVLMSILIVFFTLSITTNYIFDKAFNKYLTNVRNDKFDLLQTEISTMIANSKIDESTTKLAMYAKFEKIQIDIYDKNDNLIYILNKLKTSDMDSVNKSFDILKDNKKIGRMVISYYDDNHYDTIEKEYRNNFIYSIIIAVFISAVTGSIASFVLSNKLYRTIKNLIKTSENYKNLSFDNERIEKSNILEIDELSDNMYYLGESLKNQEKLRHDYAQDISHELRTPLTNLKLHIEAISDGIIDFDDEAKESMREEIDYLNSLIEKLKKSFNYSSENADLKIEKFSLSDLLIKINKSLSPTAFANGILIKSEIKENVYIKSDPEKITQIMYNLLSNALKASDRDDEIIVRLEHTKNQIIISVIDNGVGISEEDLDNIFNRFYRAKGQQSRKSGQGLGLAITKAMVESLNGKITVESKVGFGSTFKILLYD